MGRRENYEKRLAQLRTERSSWEQPVREISEQLVPYRAIWDPRERNRGERRDQKVLNSHPVLSLRSLSAGLIAMVTSPARTWFGYGVDDTDLANDDEVKVYLDDAKRITEGVLQTSNLYRALSNETYPDLGSIGTAPMFMEWRNNGLVFTPLVWGEYFLDVNHEGRVDTCFRELTFSVKQLVQRFGKANLPATVRDHYDKGNYNVPIVVVHVVNPNDQYSGQLDDRRGAKEWASCWYMPADDDKERFLDETGYERFPVLAPRWSCKTRDAYGRGPGWDARGDCRLLQYYEKGLIELLDKIHKPPMKAVGALRGASLLPAAITYLEAGKEGSYEPILKSGDLAQAIERLEAHISRTENRISRVFFNDLLQMLMLDDRADRPTATEVEAKRHENALQMGPVLENLNTELLEPLIENTFAHLEVNDRLPPLPEALIDQPVKVNFISIMHEMQKATGLVSVRTLMAEVLGLSQAFPDVIDKVDADLVVDELGRITGVKPDIILSKEKVGEIRAAKAEREQAAQQGQAMLAATQGMKNLSGVEPQKLSELASAMSPAVAAQGGGLGEVLQ